MIEYISFTLRNGAQYNLGHQQITSNITAFSAKLSPDLYPLFRLTEQRRVSLQSPGYFEVVSYHVTANPWRTYALK